MKDVSLCPRRSRRRAAESFIRVSGGVHRYVHLHNIYVRMCARTCFTRANIKVELRFRDIGEML